ERVHVAALDRRDELVDEAVAGEVEDALVIAAFEYLLADRLEQVGLAEAHTAVDEQRVVRLARLVADGDARGVGELVARAGDEVLKDVVRVERDGLLVL